MPDRSDKVEQLYEAADEYELPYISKSRVKQWLENPEHFRLKYLEEIKPAETQAMRRGTAIHETFEEYYYSVTDAGRWIGPEDTSVLPDDRRKWADFIDPYISNFLKWERDRWRESGKDTDTYLPIAIEAEHWRDPLLGIDGEPEWMGLADAILPSASLPEIDSAEGVTIVDFKTGSVPDEKYRSPGIYEELEYYSLLFENVYNVTGALAYYPREHETVVKDGGYTDEVLTAAAELVNASAGYDGSEKFETDEGPLCKWGESDDEESAFYGVCTQCTWGVPINNKHAFEHLVEEGYSDTEIADHFGCSTSAVNYWKYKLDL
jgi:hypothetical protein